MSAAERPPVTSLLGLAASLARQWWPQVAALAAACGVVATTISGALCVGDGMQTGLARLAVERLGRIDAAVIAEEFFTATLATNLTAGSGGPRHAVPAIVMPAIAVKPGGTTARVTLLACDDPVALGFEPVAPALEPEGVLVNQPLAAALGLAAGEAVVLRLPTHSSVPADSPLGRRTGESAGRRLSVTAVLPPEGIGQFSLRPVQATAPLVVTSLETARRILRLDDAANVVFAVGLPAGGEAVPSLRQRLAPTLADYGLALEPATVEPPSLRLTSRRLILPAAVDRAATEVLAPVGGRPTLAFLANAIAPVAGANGADEAAASVPYSTILGIDATNLPVGDLVDDRGELLAVPADGDVIIDRWLADDLAAQGRPVAIGDRLRVALFEPETIHGRVEETTAELRIAGIAAMTGAAVARAVVPEVEGITDEDSIADWDPPFPFDSARVRTTPPHDEDDRYWKAHGPTPKAFVSLATARRLAAGRFGDTTAWLLPQPADPAAVAAITSKLAATIRPEDAGLRVVPLRAEALAAARGSTPFGSLFLALSSFVVIAGLVLAWLLFSLLVAARGRDLGILAAVGFPPRRLSALLLSVGGIAAAIGTVVGTLLGPAWATALLALLGRAWTADVEPGATRAFEAAAAPLTPLVIGGVSTFVIALGALAWAARKAGGLSPLSLLRGRGPTAGRTSRRLAATIAVVGLGLAAAIAAFGRSASPGTAVELFFAAGGAALAGLLAVVRLWLTAVPRNQPLRSLAQLAHRNLAFAPGRAFSVAAIVATATFLIVAVSSFAQRPPTDLADRRGPTGGWTEIVAFGAATSVDPTDAETRVGLGLSSRQQELLADCRIERLRSSGGDDAACSNLYATLRPTVLGVGPGFMARGGFTFVAHAPTPAHDAGNPWTLLEPPAEDPLGGAEPIPAILDQATAQWGLKLGGVGSEFTLADDAGRPVRLQIVGLLAPGILQGFVLVAERHFERMFPDRSGYALALVDAGRVPQSQRPGLAAALTAAWADAGVTLTPARSRLASLQAVQNIFLAGFQALGTLGLLLGTAGVAAVQLQGLFERLGTFSVLRAVGFTLARVRLVLVVETVLMVLLGLATGVAAALLAVAPALTSGQARLPLAWIVATAGLALLAAVAAATLAATQAAIPARPAAD
jgi:putative ABC transport system permease protein